jgi:hypothetical protein
MKHHLLCFFMLIFIGCTPKETINLSNSFLLIVGVDVSKSTQTLPKISAEELKYFLVQMAENNSRKTVFIAMIGNPSNRPFLKLNLLKIPVASLSASLAERRKVKVKADKIKEINRASINQFILSYETQILQKKAENFTDIEGFFEKIGQICQEPQYQNHKKSVAIYSDGKHSVGKREGMPNINTEELKDVSFFTIGVNDQLLIDQLKSTKRVSPNAFFNNFLHQLNNSDYAAN